MLELLGSSPDGLALCDLAQRLQLPRSTAFNLAHSLIALGYAYQQPDSGKYRLGLKMFEIGVQAMNQTDAMEQIRGCMAEIHQQINETMHLGVRAGLEILYIDKLDSTQSIRMSSYIGSRAPLHCTALGKALLSSLSDTEIEELYRGHALKAITACSITQLDVLIRQLHHVRLNGYSVEREEYNENVCCVAVPLRERDGAAQYALSVSAPIFRMDDTQVRRIAELLLAAQSRLERFLKNT